MSAKERERRALRVTNANNQVGGSREVYVHSDGGRVPQQEQGGEDGEMREIPPRYESIGD